MPNFKSPRTPRAGGTPRTSRPAQPEAEPDHEPAPGRNWGGRREGAGAPRGPRRATLARIEHIRDLCNFDAASEVFAELTPGEMIRLSAWRLLAIGEWKQAGDLAARIVHRHHSRRDPQPDPDADHPSPIPSAGLSERRNGTAIADIPEHCAERMRLTPGAAAALAPRLHGEVIDPANPLAHWTDREIAERYLSLRARNRRLERRNRPAPEPQADRERAALQEIPPEPPIHPDE